MNHNLKWFTKTFINKNKQKRFLEVLNKDHYKLQDELHRIDKYLNQRCVLISKNAQETFDDIKVKYQLDTGILIDY